MTRLLATLVFLLSSEAACQEEYETRTWTSSSGKYTRQAKLISFAGGVVSLERDDGKAIQVKATQLSETDHLYIVEYTGWGRIWKSQTGSKFLIADLKEIKDGVVTVEKIDGELFDVPFQRFSRDDQRYIEQRMPSAFDFDSITYPAKVVGISDGDTVTILIDNTQHKLRLNGIDAPEIGQAFSQKSKKALSDLVFGKMVWVDGCGKDKYGRLLGDISVDGKSVSMLLVKAGLAWHYKKYSDNESLAKAETSAKEAKTGLWIENAPVAPWEFRAMGPSDRKKYALSLQENDNQARGPPNSKSKNSSTKSSSSKNVAGQSSTPSQTQPAPLSHWLNINSGVRHNRSCRWYGNTKSGRACSANEGRACGKCGG